MFILDEYIEDYIVSVDDSDDKIIARHLKKIIPETTHLDKNTFDEIFDEDEPGNDPFANHKVIDIINMLALPSKEFAEGEPKSAIKLKYRNMKNIQKKFPVFFDPGWYDKFFPSDKNDKYGRSKSLDKSLRNMPEVVHENLKISEVTENIEFLKD
jgi:hypothetical protein